MITAEMMVKAQAMAERMTVAFYSESECKSLSDYNFNLAKGRLAELNTIMDSDSTFQFRTINNPHLTTYKEDDRKPHTSCPHCGNEDDYDEELRCPVCGLWNADQAAAKLYRLIELAKNFTDDELDKAFTLIVTEVVG